MPLLHRLNFIGRSQTPSGQNLLDAIDYARKIPGGGNSMSWGGAEFSDEVSLDNHFVDGSGKLLFSLFGR